MCDLVDAVVFFDNAFQVAGGIGVGLCQTQSLGAKFRAKPAAADMAAQVDELAHQQAPVVVAASNMACSALKGVLRGPGHMHEFIGPFAEVQIADEDAAIFALGGDASVRFPVFGGAGTDQ